MRYITNENGYIQAVSFNNLLECQNKSCTEYTGTVPTGYETLAEWNENANINAYKIVNGNLTYDSEEDARLQSLWASQQASGGSSVVSGDTLPIGSMIPYGNSTPPTNWLVCDGRAVSRTTYAELFKVIGTSYGAGDGSTTFNLPNKKGKVSVGLDTSDTDFNSIGKTGGEKNVKLEFENYVNGVWNSKQGHSSNDLSLMWEPSGSKYGLGLNYTANKNTPHNNLQPYEVDCWIIKAFQSVGVVGNVLSEKNDSTTDTYSCDYVNNLLNTLYPVGKVEIFFDNDDHSNHLGFKWERTSIGKVPVGINTSDNDFNTIGKTGGEKKHTLTTDEMPSHTHDLINYKISANGTSGSTNGFDYVLNGADWGAISVAYNGKGQPHNNLQPYEVMAFWKRIS